MYSRKTENTAFGMIQPEYAHNTHTYRKKKHAYMLSSRTHIREAPPPTVFCSVKKWQHPKCMNVMYHFHIIMLYLFKLQFSIELKPKLRCTYYYDYCSSQFVHQTLPNMDIIFLTLRNVFTSTVFRKFTGLRSRIMTLGTVGLCSGHALGS